MQMQFLFNMNLILGTLRIEKEEKKKDELREVRDLEPDGNWLQFEPRIRSTGLLFQENKEFQEILNRNLILFVVDKDAPVLTAMPTTYWPGNILYCPTTNVSSDLAKLIVNTLYEWTQRFQHTKIILISPFIADHLSSCQWNRDLRRIHTSLWQDTNFYEELQTRF